MSGDGKDPHLPLASVLDFYGVRYNPARTSQKVCCPIHGERDPSMSINLEKDAFKCHSCGAQGGPFQFIKEKEGIDYVAARKFAADHGLHGRDDGGGGESLPGWAIAGRGRVSGRPRDRAGDGGYVAPWLRY